MFFQDRRSMLLDSYSSSTPILLQWTLLMVCFSIWIYAIAHIHIASWTPDPLFYIKNLTTAYWIGLGILMLAVLFRMVSFSSNAIGRLDLVLILLLVLYLFGTVSFVEPFVRALDIYARAAAYSSVLNIGHLISFQYTNDYPGSFIYFGTIIGILGLSWQLVFKIYPIFLVYFISVMLWIMSKKYFGLRGALITCLVFVGYSWFTEYDASPESYGLLVYAVIWMVIILALKEERGVRIQDIVILMLLIGAVVVSHAGTPIFTIFNLLSLAIVSILKPYRKFAQVNGIFLVTIVMFLGWLMFRAGPDFHNITELVFRAFRSATAGATPTVAKNVPYSKSYGHANLLRYGVVALSGIVGGWSLIRIIRLNRIRDALILLSWLVGDGLFGLYTLFANAQLIERPAMFALFPISVAAGVLATPLASTRRILRITFKVSLAVVVLAGILSLPITRYANDPIETPTAAGMAAKDFLEANAQGEVIFPAGRVAPASPVNSINDYTFMSTHRITYVYPGYPFMRYGNYFFSELNYNYWTMELGSSGRYDEIKYLVLRSGNIYYDNGSSQIALYDTKAARAK